MKSMKVNKRKYSINKVNCTSTLILASTLVVAVLSCHLPSIFAFMVLIVCWFSMLYFSHCLAHYLIGSILGIKFKYYTLSRSMLSKKFHFLENINIFLTLRLDEKPKGWKGFAMFVAGPVSSMLTPLTIVVISWTCHPFISKILLLLTVFNALFTGYFSSKYGCVYKGLKCLK
ncbi:MAG: hypothetical protein DSY33_01370 [Archaeoglobus sp.]|nr:MAG: hypothetical protein DSY33_01370 [Archaeoglobus sp.]